MARDAVTREQAEASLRAQAARTARLGMADDVVTNTGRIEDLRDQVDALHLQYVNFAREKRTLVPPLSR
jgi:dephospho-CoA kinase